MGRILIVDDEKNIRITLGEFLRDEGHAVREVENADEALQRLSEAEFDVVVTDIILPRITGVELLRRIHATAPQVQVVMMTGEPTIETASESLRAGAADYLFKPITKEAIVRVVANAVKLKTLEDNKRQLEAENRAYQENLERLVDERAHQLRLSEERYRALVETAFDWVWEVDAQGRYSYVSPHVWNLIGYRPEEVLGRTPFDFMPEDEARRVKALFEAAAAARQPFVMLENINRHRDGRLIILETSGTPKLGPDGTLLGYHGMDRDITERKQKEERLHLQNSALEAAANAVVITDRDGVIEWANAAFTTFTGYSAAEAVGKKLGGLIRSGQHDAAFYHAIWETILAGRVWHGEIVNRRKDGSLYTEEMAITPVRNTTGQIIRFIAIKQDITERKKLEAQFLRAQRLEGIGALAGGIAHDLNNILAPMLMIAPFLRDTAPDNDSRQMLETIESCAQRGADVIKQLLLFARGTSGARAPLPMRHLLREMDKLIRETFPRDIHPVVNSPEDLWLLLGDPTQLHQALLNLCVNARDAMPDGGTLTLCAKNVTVDETFASMACDARPGAYVCVSVTDTGAGIAPENLNRIFDPFFTTKEIGKGTGLGLSTVFGIVRGHEGFVRVDSRLGHGTTFDLHFPASPEAKAANANANAGESPLPRGQGELILVVDDEPAVRDGVRRTLESQGYRVTTATQGAEGVAVFSQHATEIRAVLTDMMMPVMNGPAMIAVLRQLEPRLVVLGMTGLPERTGVKGLDVLDLAVMLIKPFSGDELLRALHAALKPSVAHGLRKGAE